MSRVVTAPSHTQAAFDTTILPRIVRWAEDIVLKHRAEAILVCGHSGLLVAGALSYATRIPVLAARKDGETGTNVSSHNEITAVIDSPADRWVWLDDLLASGGTFRRSVRRAIDAGLITTPVPQAILAYNRSAIGYRQHNVFGEPRGDFRLGGWDYNSMDSGLYLVAEYPERRLSSDAKVPEYGFVQAQT